MTDLQPGTNALVLASSMSAAKRELCVSLQNYPPAERIDALRISYSDTPQELLNQWRAADSELPARIGIILVNERLNRDSLDTDLPETASATAINPNDLTGLSIQVHKYLEHIDEHSQFVVCLDSVTEMIHFSGVETTYRFLDKTIERFRAADGIGHCHLDPAAHDTQVVERMKPLFDEVFEV